jgi:hypothetical protein
MLPSRDSKVAMPVNGLLGDSIIAQFEELPRYASGRGMHHYVKECRHVPSVKSSPLGQRWGLGRDALGFYHLLYSVAGRVSLHLFDCPPSRTKSMYPRIHAASTIAVAGGNHGVRRLMPCVPPFRTRGIVRIAISLRLVSRAVYPSLEV